jgi:serine protease
MRQRNWNRLVQTVMAVTLLGAAVPLLLPYWPAPPLAPHPAAGDSQPLPGQIAVDAKDTLTDAQLQALNARYGLNLQYNSPPSAADEKLLVGTVPPDQESAILEQLRHDPLVEADSPVYRYEKYWTPNDPRYPEQWNLKLVGAEKAWDKARGKGVVVAVIDTGVAFENDDRCYQARDFAQTKFVKGYDFIHNDEHPYDDYGHGTHVAGTIAESTDNGEGVAGLAPEATIMPIKVLDEYGFGSSADIADAIRFAADHGANIINMSLGGSQPDVLTHEACKYAAKKGVLIVCAAGNSGGGAVGYPAGFPECLAVSAVGPTGSLAPYSSVGKEVGIAAPGGDGTHGEQDKVLQNTLLGGARESDSYYAFQGTSMASPHVAAVAALIMSMGIRDAAEVKQLLQRAATPKKPAVEYGAGLLSASRSVQLAEAAQRNSFLKLVFTVIAFALGIGVGVIRKQLGALTRVPYVPLGFAFGLLGPDLIFGWLGFGSPFNIVLHSALIPLYLLWEAESGPVYRFVAAMALGMTAHLAWDALWGHAPFGGILPMHALPWLWVNVMVAVGVALVAWRRSFAAEG